MESTAGTVMPAKCMVMCIISAGARSMINMGSGFLMAIAPFSDMLESTVEWHTHLRRWGQG